MMFGGRGGPSWLRYIRVALLLGIIVLALTLGHSNSKAYNTIHTVYLVIIVALLIGSLAYGRSRGGVGGPNNRGRGGRQRGGPWNAGDPSVGHGGFGTPPPSAPASPPVTPPNPASEDPGNRGI
jgi:hypothetical protein